MRTDTDMDKPWLKLADDDLEGRFGIICPDGHFYPCDYGGHINLAFELTELGMLGKDAHYLDVENTCIMISAMPMTCSKRLTPRQKVTLERFFDKHMLFEENGYHKDMGFMFADVHVVLVNGKAQCRRA